MTHNPILFETTPSELSDKYDEDSGDGISCK